MDKLLSLLSTYLDSAGKVIATQGPKAWAATLDLIRMHAIYDFVIWLILLVFFSVMCLKIHKWAQAEKDVDYYAVMIPFAILGLITVGCGLGGGFDCFLGAFRPDLFVLNALAHKAGIL